jgi:chromosome segregation ATPase
LWLNRPYVYLIFYIFEDCTEDDTTRTAKAVYEMLMPALENLNKRFDVLTCDRDTLMQEIEEKKTEIESKEIELRQVREQIRIIAANNLATKREKESKIKELESELGKLRVELDISQKNLQRKEDELTAERRKGEKIDKKDGKLVNFSYN